eukprot:CAMPEP_0184376094 /NCGR_PEP_ID=MMETSP0007-20130409/1163_1 /TAXON_ID=97485 /ORGANISM="Prymnesium parvum, Strain Texoma1" /LENGTH=153 /DNA_ID=CAMNT_0026719513 /DNA_START=85 /DNA_END=546 /DNA_ORIENTATION=+
MKYDAAALRIVQASKGGRACTLSVDPIRRSVRTPCVYQRNGRRLAWQWGREPDPMSSASDRRQRRRNIAPGTQREQFTDALHTPHPSEGMAGPIIMRTRWHMLGASSRHAARRVQGICACHPLKQGQTKPRVRNLQDFIPFRVRENALRVKTK